MDFGLRWIRRRQRPLARAVLALFCIAWLQAAIVPCVLAHDRDATPQVGEAGQPRPDAHGGHDHAAIAAAAAADDASRPCLYCPPGASDADSRHGHGGCAFPHEPQVDARAAGAILTALPVSFVVPSPGAMPVAHRADPAVPEAVPRIRLSVSYCRFLE